MFLLICNTTGTWYLMYKFSLKGYHVPKFSFYLITVVSKSCMQLNFKCLPNFYEMIEIFHPCIFTSLLLIHDAIFSMMMGHYHDIQVFLMREYHFPKMSSLINECGPTITKWWIWCKFQTVTKIMNWKKYFCIMHD